MGRMKFIVGGVLILAAVVYLIVFVHAGQRRVLHDDQRIEGQGSRASSARICAFPERSSEARSNMIRKR